MKKKLTVVSKLLYLCTFLSFFLPAFLPACTEEKAPDPTPVDTTAAIVDTLPPALATDTPSVSPDTISPNQSETQARSIFYPDRKNQSFWGYLVWYLFESLIAIFVLLTIWSGVLRWLNKKDLEIAIQQTVASLALVAFVLSDYDMVVWGFWFAFSFSIANTICNWIIPWSKSQDKSAQ